jgi:hypothetical protein
MNDPNAINNDMKQRVQSNSSGTAGFFFDTLLPMVVIGGIAAIATAGLSLAYTSLTTPAVTAANIATTTTVDALTIPATAAADVVTTVPALFDPTLLSQIAVTGAPQALITADTAGLLALATGDVAIGTSVTASAAGITAITTAGATSLLTDIQSVTQYVPPSVPSSTVPVDITALAPVDITTNLPALYDPTLSSQIAVTSAPQALITADTGGLLSLATGGAAIGTSVDAAAAGISAISTAGGTSSLLDTLSNAMPSTSQVATAVKAGIAAGLAGSVKKAPAPAQTATNNFWLYAAGAGALFLIIKKAA